ncbi:hypothetical protein F5Y08DRAFT_138650 [Xylaria arbuscula]|nr:hypothetical protein F5Y08DRAFT_138650 [Xylaria arbuscula]
MRVTKFDQKTCLLDCIEKLQAATEALETIATREQSSTGGKRTWDAGEEPSITGLESTPTAKRRRLPLEELLTTVRDPSQRAGQQVGYLRDGGLHSYEILHGAGSNPAADDDIRGFSFCTEGPVHLGHQRQVRRLLQRKGLMHSAAIAPASNRRRSLPADIIIPLHDPFDDEVLPLYGDAEEDYDIEMWDEIEKERREDERQLSLTSGLPTDTVNIVLDNIVHSWELQWREAKLPTLLYEAPVMWRKLHGGSGTSARRKLSQEQHRLKTRICEMRKAVVEAGPWYTERELSRHAANLRPSIHDYLKIGWALDLARQESEPKEAARPPARQKIGTANAHDNDDTGTGEELESEPDNDKPTTTPWQGSYKPEGDQAVLGRREERPPNHSAHVAIKKGETVNLKSTNNNTYAPGGQAAATSDNSPALCTTKRKREGEENHCGPCKKRAELTYRGLELIELSDDDDEGDNQNKKLQPLEHNSYNHGTEGNSGSDDDEYRIDETDCPQEDPQLWRDCCEFFGHDQAKVSTEKSSHWYRFKDTGLLLKPFQLYAVYWILTQPRRNVLGAFLADDPGLGKSYIVFGVMATRSALLMNDSHIHDHPASHCMPGRECPRPYACGIRCSCEGGVSRSLLRVVLEGPQVIVCPPSILREWITKFEETLGSDRNRAGFQLKVIAAADSLPGEQQSMLLSQSNTGSLLAEVTGEVKWRQKKGEHVPDHSEISVKGRPGQSKTIILSTSSYVLRGIQQLFLRNERYRKAECSVSNVAISFIAADECHQYHGSSKKPTQPLRIAEELARCSGFSVPSFWLGVSGTPMESGPRDIKATVEHIQYMQRNSRVGLSDRDLGMDGFQAAYNAVANKTLEELRNASHEVWESFCSVRDEFMGRLIIARSGDGTFQCSSLAVFRLPQVREIECPFPTAYKHLLTVDEDEFGRLVAKTLQKLREQWEANGRARPQPNLATAKQHFMKTQHAHHGSLPGNSRRGRG